MNNARMYQHREGNVPLTRCHKSLIALPMKELKSRRYIMKLKNIPVFLVSANTSATNIQKKENPIFFELRAM
jgi:hypothetical protein